MYLLRSGMVVLLVVAIVVLATQMVAHAGTRRDRNCEGRAMRQRTPMSPRRLVPPVGTRLILDVLMSGDAGQFS